MIVLGLLKIKAPSEIIIAKFKIPNSSHIDAPGCNSEPCEGRTVSWILAWFPLK